MEYIILGVLFMIMLGINRLCQLKELELKDKGDERRRRQGLM